MKTPIGKVLLMLAALATPLLAQAGVADNLPPGIVPEPGVLELLGLGAAVAIAIAIRKRRR